MQPTRSKCLYLILWACLAAPLLGAGERRPNIVVFLVDDLGWQDLSLALGPETTEFNRRYHTPHVERLASMGLSFTEAYSSAPVCSPTRTSLLTGMSPAATGITWWVLRKDTHRSKKHPTLEPPPWRVNGLQPGDTTLPGLLSAAGYWTIHIGKAHLGAKETPGEDPTQLGFDVNIAGHGAGGPGSYYGKENFSAVHRRGSRVWDVPGLKKYHGEDVYLTDALAMEARAALMEAAERDQPFFLHFAPYAVHAPISPNPRLLEKYSHLDAKEAAYATMVESMDDALGVVLETLEEAKLLETTLILFTSDNGGLSAHSRGGKKHTHNAPLRSGKGSCYEGGIRVPTVIAWPGQIPPDTRSPQPIITHDWFPTLLGAAGAAIPEEHGEKVEGWNLLGQLKAPSEATRDRSLFWHQPHLWGAVGPGVWPFSAVRRGPWKLIYRHDDQTVELYHLKRDLGEESNVAHECPEVAQSLAEELSLWLERVDGKMSLQKETLEEVPLPRIVFDR